MILWLLLPVLSHSQSHTIDSLRLLLPSLKGSSRIDCLNKLSSLYYINALAETYLNVHTDTAIMLATNAYNEAQKIRYTRGIAEALQNLGEIARDRNDFRAAERYFRQSIPLFEQLNEQDKYGWANITFGYSNYQQGRYAAARLAYERAITSFVKTGNKEKQSIALRLISSTYSLRGYNEKAFENTRQAIEITNKINDTRGVMSSPENMGMLYRDAGQTDVAVSYFRLAASKAKNTNPVRYYRLMGDIAVMLNRLDSAVYYFTESHRQVTLATDDGTVIDRDLAYKNLYIADVLLKQHRYKDALEKLQKTLLFFERGNCVNGATRVLRSMASCYLEQGNLSRAYVYAKRFLLLGEQSEARPFIRDAYEIYSKIYDRQGRIGEAYKYHLKFIAIKDSIQSDEYRRNIALSDMRSVDEQQKAKIDLLQKDRQLTQQQLSLQQQKIKSESVIKYILLAATLLLAMIGFFIFWNINLRRKNDTQQLEHKLALQQLESQKAAAEFQQQAGELELQALRAQMNPHFIFNCLSSINRFILISKTEEASDYLTKFSRLIRMVLHNSEKSFVTLENELEALRLYLDLEQLRFKSAFNYHINFPHYIDPAAVYVPPMLIQPFAENAIWHGLMHKKSDGNLEIDLTAGYQTVTCVITDNGIGRNMAASLKSRSAEKNKSMGVGITSNRLALLNKSTDKFAVFDIEDLKDAHGNDCGTKVVLTMPCKSLADIASSVIY